MCNYNVLLASDEATVVDEYIPEVQNRQQYQSEADLEKDMIKSFLEKELNISV